MRSSLIVGSQVWRGRPLGPLQLLAGLRCLQCTVVTSLASLGNTAKQFESSLLDECCNRRLSSSRVHFRITDVWAPLVECIQTSLWCHCQAPDISITHDHRDDVYTVQSYLRWQRYTGIPDTVSEGLHATMCQLNPSLDILVISTT